MEVYYLAAILLCRIIQAIFSKQTSNAINSIPLLIKYSGTTQAISATFAFALLVIKGTSLTVSPLAVVISVLSGLSIFFATFFSVFAMKTGTISAVSMFGTAGLLIPLIVGVFCFDQPILPLQWVGVAFFFVAAFLLLKSSKETYTVFNIKTVLLLIGSLVSNGMTMVMQQLYTRVIPDGDVSVFSFISFASVAVLSVPFFFCFKKSAVKAGTATDFKLSKMLKLCVVAIAVALFVINQFATICTAFVAPVILFTVINGGGTIISTVVAAVMYREKITLKIALGIIIGIASLVVIKAFAAA